MGYVASISLLRCTDGLLNPASFSCSPAPCTAPAGIDHSAVSPCVEGNTTGHGEVCTASCHPGYEAFPSYLSCGLGVLTPQEFVCSAATCAAPSGVSDVGSPPCVEGNSVNFGSTCTARCASGFVPSVE